ncbi:MAG: Pycsar system effector family protein [Bacteroidota bacterium]
MTRSTLLEKLYQHAFDMVQFGESKNTTLISFNVAAIIGMAFVCHFTSNFYICYYACFAILFSGISILIGFSALIAKVKNKTYDINLTKNDNLLYFATVAHMTDTDLLEKLSSNYGCISENENYERDLAKQAIITSQIASRKFKLYNLAIGFTFAGIATPISVLVYKFLIDRDK